ncbi:MAG: threonine--tRNA ligase [Deltaproteobacteria bacterium]|nr:threonine--tRNA ligase [Deltaproteobacteria bacterium]
MIIVKFSDEEDSNYPEGITAGEVLFGRYKGLSNKIVAAKVNGNTVDLSTPLKDPDTALRVEPVTVDSEEGIGILRHSAAHIMAQAVKGVYKDVKLGIGPAIEDGFYYDFDTPAPFTPEDIEKIEKRMEEIIKGDSPFEREELKKDDALNLFKGMGETYKEELIRELGDDGVSIYRQSGFVDLCRGPHLPKTGMVKAFKITSTAGAYWRGDEKRKMLQRVYGTAFPDKKQLAQYLRKIDEAKKRDHRKLGRELDLFSVSEEVGPGLILWHPDGATVRLAIEDFWRKGHIKNGYSLVYTPHVAKLDMWKRSGHWDFYRENLFSPMDVEGQDYIVKPMNCPFHIQIFKSRLRSYRDLPIRYAELGTVYRFERSGVLHGLLRVRGFTQDDAHIYLAPGQIEDEVKSVLKFTLYILRAFGFNEYEIFLSTRPEKYVGSIENWAMAWGSLKAALEGEGLPYSVDPGEGVFYGPKIDIKIKDALGRAWQCSTIQADFNLPERFDVTYRDERGVESRPIMLHRALMGSLERFFGCLVEHYAGAFPLWLSPVQVVVLNVTERNVLYAGRVFEAIKEKGLRAEFDSRNETLNYKIREARLRKVPYMVIIGDREEEKGVVSPRSRDTGEMAQSTVQEFIESLERENKTIGGGPS